MIPKNSRKMREMVKTLPSAPDLRMRKRKDNTALSAAVKGPVLAGPRIQKAADRYLPAEIKCGIAPHKWESVETEFVSEASLETDPDFRPSRVKLADHARGEAWCRAQVAYWQGAGFLPVAVSRLVGLRPSDIKRLTEAKPAAKSKIQSPKSKPERKRKMGRMLAMVAAAALSSCASQKQPGLALDPGIPDLPFFQSLTEAARPLTSR